MVYKEIVELEVPYISDMYKSSRAKPNIIYIRAAIEAAMKERGIPHKRIPLSKLRDMLLEEGLITKAQAKDIIFPGYEVFSAQPREKPPQEEPILAVDQVIKDEEE